MTMDLRWLGVHCVSSTRDSSIFKYETDHISHGHLSYVLNSLSHSGYIEAAVALAREQCCFIEIGKRAIKSRTQMATRTQTRYCVVAVDKTAELDPTWLQQVTFATHICYPQPGNKSIGSQ